MLTNLPTWTTDRVELLKSHFEAGLTCREIAASIGVSRNAVIGKLARLELTRGPARAKPSPEKTARERSRKRQTVPLADQHARRGGFLLLRQYAG